MVLLVVVMVLAERVSALVLTQAWIDGGRHEQHEAQEPQEQQSSPEFLDWEREVRSRWSVSARQRESEGRRRS
jgi:hypothetical protein